ncbi:hypothetical protein DEU56DRAFT_759191 [Suillus clintonianus]|uniref:uncharacterized protein n=1 Tax=Suillus clintonianus TaxID=1904413 RepID=UPI001B86B245|nr:uncharacterized protein DEU56DRAFT_759191 [Suillus clintonianus]KAG2125686.1 hypothetical protein DEU56DRAFT_759191 [Suillus clintonianus]
MNENYETIQVTLQYGGVKGGRLISGMTSKTEALRNLLADLSVLRAHRPKGENIRQEGAVFFLLWPHPANAPVPLVEGSLYKRWVAIAQGSPELTAVKNQLSILSSIGFTGSHGTTNLSPLGPKHTIELPRMRTEGMNDPLAEQYFTTDHLYSQEPEVAQGKRPRSDSVNERDLLSPSFGPDGNNESSSSHASKKIRTEQHFPIQNSTAEEKHTLNGFSTGNDQTTQLDEISQSRFPIPLVSRIPPFGSYHMPFPGSTGVSNSPVPTAPRPPQNREAIKRLSLELSKVRGQLTTLRHCEQGISEELVRLGVPQPKSEEAVPSPHGLVHLQFDMEAQLILIEIELQQERIQRLRAERMLSEVERECRAPFVVPALFQAFCRISELGHNE